MRTKAQPAGKNFVDRYFEERLDYGGELWTRAEIIRDLRQIGAPERLIYRWLQGAEYRKTSGKTLLEMPPASLSIH